MTPNLQERVNAALSTIRNNRLGVNVLEAEMVRDVATTLDGKVRFTLLLAPSDDLRLPSRLKGALERASDGSGPFQRVVYFDSHDDANKHGRIPGLVAPGDSEGWLARKIAALGAGLLFTAPGIPMLFMGDEFLEWKTWSDGRDEFMDWGRIGRFPGFVDLVRRLYRDGKLKIRIYKAISGPSADADRLISEGPVLGEFNGRLTVRTIKVVMDGALGSRGAALLGFVEVASALPDAS